MSDAHWGAEKGYEADQKDLLKRELNHTTYELDKVTRERDEAEKHVTELKRLLRAAKNKACEECYCKGPSCPIYESKPGDPWSK